MNKYAGYVFSFGSVLMLAMILIYIEPIHSTTPDWQTRIDNLNANWAAAATIWRLEFIAVIALAWSAFHFSKSDSAWFLVGIAHVIMAMQYSVMLAGYPEVKSEESYQILFQIAVWIFAASNFIYLLGMAIIYSRFSNWIKYTGMLISSVAAIGFLGLFFNIFTAHQAMYFGALIALLYLLNAWVGIRYFAKGLEQFHIAN